MKSIVRLTLTEFAEPQRATSKDIGVYVLGAT